MLDELLDDDVVDYELLDLFDGDNGVKKSSVHCKHGTYIGDPYGADYLCQWCENGE